jgi:hypothetical protein
MSDRDQKQNSRGNENGSEKALANDRRMARAMKMVESNDVQRDMYNQNPAGYLRSLGIETGDIEPSKLALRTETLSVLSGDQDARLHLTITLTPVTWPGPTVGGGGSSAQDPSKMTLTATCSITVTNPNPGGSWTTSNISTVSNTSVGSTATITSP